MHFKRKPGHGKAVVISLIILVLMAALAAGIYFLWPLMSDIFAPSQPAVTEPLMAVRGLLAEPLTDPAFTGDEASMQAYLDELVQYAAARGINTLFMDMLSNGAAFYRDRAYPIAENISAGDGLFHKFDPMKYLCKAAEAQGLSVCAVFPSPQDDETLAASINRAQRKYDLGGAYYKEAADGALGQLVGTGATGGTLPYTTGLAWSQPSSLFVSAVKTGTENIVFDSYATARANAETFSLLVSAADVSSPAPTLAVYTPNTALTITYPAEDAVLYTQNCFIMGTSDPNVELLCNGEPVERTTQSGLFGVLVSLEAGPNTITFTQGDNTLTWNISRIVSGGGGASGGSDNTQSVPEGSYIRTTGWITSLLYDPSSDGNISETVRRGSIARVTNCVQTTRSGKLTWAYQLESGDYVLAYNTEYLGASITVPHFTSAAAVSDSAGEILTFNGEGTPLAYTKVDGNNLALDFYSATAAADFAVQNSRLISGASVTEIDGGVQITLHCVSAPYGYSIEHTEDGKTQLILKNTPVRSSTFGKPLEGVSVLLDAGHGADDAGAMGTAGSTQPQEKDVNLSVALAAKYRLEQMGATVHMIRTDDTFLTLEERNAMIISTKADFFIALHHNSVALTVDANSAQGTECYYFYPNGKTLAETLVREVTQVTGRAERGTDWGYYYVTRSTMCPAVLLELGFMVNPSEYENVVDPSMLWAEGDAVARSILACVPEA